MIGEESVRIDEGPIFDTLEHARRADAQAVRDVLAKAVKGTQISVFVGVLALFLFGGGDLRSLTLCLLIGMTAGVYSTIYVATPIVLLFHRELQPGGQRLGLPSQANSSSFDSGLISWPGLLSPRPPGQAPPPG